MLKHVLATTALATLLASGAYAQEAPATDPATDPTVAPAPMPDSTMGDEGSTTPPEVVEDSAPGEMEADTAADPAGTMGSPELAEEPMPGTMDTDTAAPGTDMMDPAMEGDWGPVDLATVSTDELIGTDIRNHNEETIATIEDVIITDDGQVENIVARFGGFLGFGADRVLLTVEELEVMQDENENVVVRTDLTPESIETRPAYEG